MSDTKQWGRVLLEDMIYRLDRCVRWLVRITLRDLQTKVLKCLYPSAKDPTAHNGVEDVRLVNQRVLTCEPGIQGLGFTPPDDNSLYNLSRRFTFVGWDHVIPITLLSTNSKQVERETLSSVSWVPSIKGGFLSFQFSRIWKRLNARVMEAYATKVAPL